MSPSSSASSDDQVISIDITQESWDTEPFSSDASMITPDFWSPDGQWLAVAKGANLCFWAISVSKTLDPCIEDDGSFLSPVAWTPDSRMFVYQQGLALFTIDLYSPDNKILVVDLSTLGIEDDDPFTVIYAWIAPLS